MENQLDYYRRRATEEERRAEQASGPEARLIHEHMAGIYSHIAEQGVIVGTRDRPWAAWVNP